MKKILKWIKRWLDLSHQEPWRKTNGTTGPGTKSI